MNRLIPTLFVLASLASLPAAARSPSLVEMQVLDLDQSQTLPRHPHQGRDYIEGLPGHRYAVVLQNLTGERVLAVVSVDGVNAISGETAGSQQAGYVLQPWQRVEVRGWRKNLSEIAEFQFTSLGDSYAARTGRPGNVGVIGVAAFRERQPLPPPRWEAEIAEAAPIAKSRAGAAEARAPQSAAESASSDRYDASRSRQQLGTGHGSRRLDAATATEFERASLRPTQVLTVWYDSHQALVARGVIPNRWPHTTHSPEAFPIGFAPDPR
ncbi:hypothetical protein [Arenimonas alkanexedens]